MSIFFYNIFGIIIGVVIIVYLLSNLKYNKKLFTIISFILGVALIGIGIYGLFIPSNLDFIIIIILLALAVLLILASIFLNSKSNVKKKK